MYSKAKISGHPIHVMLVAFPIAFYTAACVGYVYNSFVSADPLWFKVAYLANVAGVITALAAAIPGFIDWAVGIPLKTKAKTTGLFHMFFHVTALVLFAACAWLNSDQFYAAVPETQWTVVLSVIGLGMTVSGGFLGWKLVSTHHVGIDLSLEQERIDLSISAAPGLRSVPLERVENERLKTMKR